MPQLLTLLISALGRAFVVKDDPAARAQALVERLFALLHDCRAIVRELEPGPER